MKSPAFFKKLIAFLNPLPPIGGLAVTDDAIHFLFQETGKAPRIAAVRLPAETFENGKIKNREAFRAALHEVRRSTGRGTKGMQVVLSLPPEAVYTQSFSIPSLEESRLEEAARLNLQMLSPIDFSSAYTGWQRIVESSHEGAQVDLLGAFVDAGLVKDFIALLAEAGFAVAAVEFPSLALTRLLARDPRALPSASYLFAYVAADGISLMVIRNRNLYFNHFHSWREVREEIGGREMGLSELKAYLAKEVQKVMNFYSGRWGGVADGIFIAATGGVAELSKMLGDAFAMPVEEFAPAGIGALSPAWFPVFGAALRGMLPRAEDAFLSLTDEPVQAHYREARTFRFVSLWRNVTVTAALFIAALFFGGERFLASEEARLRNIAVQVPPETVEITGLKTQAQDFNNLADRAFAASQESVRWSVLFSLVENLAREKVALAKISAEIKGIVVNGTAKKTEDALGFRDALSREANIEKVDLPLKNIHERPDGTVDFSLTFSLKSLEF